MRGVDRYAVISAALLLVAIGLFIMAAIGLVSGYPILSMSAGGVLFVSLIVARLRRHVSQKRKSADPTLSVNRKEPCDGR
jgi:hypothetical protein